MAALVAARAKGALRWRHLRLHRRLCRGLDGDAAGLCALRRAFDCSLTPDHLHLVLPQEEADAAIELRRDLARALHNGRRIGGDGAVELQTIILGMLGEVQHLGRPKQSLGWDAAPIETDPTEVLAFDDRRLEPELRRADRRDVATGTGTDDDDVEGGVGHRHSLECRAGGGLGGRTTMGAPDGPEPP